MLKATSKQSLTKACDPAFARLLANHKAALLDSKATCIYGLWPDMRLAYFSPGWFAFAAVNGGMPVIAESWGLGSNAIEAIGGPLRNFYRRGYERCLEERRPWEHCYECSSATRYRWFHMISYPVKESRGLLVVHSLRAERAHTHESSGPVTKPELYIHEDGMLRQCSYCRRMRRVDAQGVWDWVSEWVSKPPGETSHSVCEACYGFYSESMDAGSGFPLPFSAGMN